MGSETRGGVVLLVVLVACCATSGAGAVVLRHDGDLERTVALGSRFPSVCSAGGGSGTLIQPRWVLTAAHVVEAFGPFDYAVRFDQREYEVIRTFVHAGADEMPWDRRTDDLALLMLREPVEGVEPARWYRGGGELGEMEELGKVATIAGTGLFGLEGEALRPRDGRRRAVTNKIVNVEEPWLEVVFSRPPGGTELEGMEAPGDSGGPLFVEWDGERWLVGVGSYAEYIDAEGDEGSYGAVDFYVRVAAYGNWIEEVISAAEQGGTVPSERAVPSRDIRDVADGLPGGVGTLAQAYFEAFNSGDPEAFRRFTLVHRIMSDEEGPSLEERLRRYRARYQEWGRLRPRRYVLTDAGELFVLVESRAGEMTFGFRRDSATSDRLASITIGY